jgi:hypothetical protein
MLGMLRVLFLTLNLGVQCRRYLVLENLALRQQLAVLAAKYLRPRLAAHDRLFWVVLRRLWSGWRQIGWRDYSCDNNRLQQGSTNFNTSAPKADQAAYGSLLKLSENKCF